MPIAFPPARMGSLFDDYPLRYRSPFAVVPAPHLGRPGTPLTASTLHPGGAWPLVATNLLRLGTMYQNVQDTAIINPVNTVWTDRLVYDRELNTTQYSFSGVSRDSAGAILATCQVNVVRTADKVLEVQTVSDGSGNWSVFVTQPRHYFFVEYKAGVPDVFGTSLDDRTPIQR